MNLTAFDLFAYQLLDGFRDKLVVGLVSVTRAPKERPRVTTTRPDEGVRHVRSAPGIVSRHHGVVPVNPVSVSGVDGRPRNCFELVIWAFGGIQ